MRACARCGQEFNPAPISGTIDWPQTDCNFCQGLFLSASSFRVLYALDWLAINRGNSRIDSRKIALAIGKRHSIVISALKELAKSGIIARQLPQKDRTFCRRCGREFDPTPERSGAGRPRTQCSMCRSGKNGHNYTYVLKPKNALNCCHCSKVFMASDARRKFCSRECLRGATLEKIKISYEQGRIAKKCEMCGGPSSNSEHQRTRRFCTSCAKENKRNVQRRRDHEKRARGKLPTKAEVLDRWSNRCHLCEKKIDLDLPSMNRLGFTFDHVVPVSKGGTNDLQNIRPAHRSCNSARGNRGPVQLDLEMCA